MSLDRVLRGVVLDGGEYQPPVQAAVGAPSSGIERIVSRVATSRLETTAILATLNTFLDRNVSNIVVDYIDLSSTRQLQWKTTDESKRIPMVPPLYGFSIAAINKNFNN